jgi:hypothetical protein
MDEQIRIEDDFGACGIHNLRILVLVGCLVGWAARIVYVLKELQGIKRLHADVQSALEMPRMGGHIDELRQLTWNHVSQLWRMQLSPSTPVPKWNLAGHFAAESFKQEGGVVELHVDAVVDVTVLLAFGARRSAVQSLTESRYRPRSRNARGGTVELETRGHEDRSQRTFQPQDCARLVEEEVSEGLGQILRVPGEIAELPNRPAGTIPLAVLVLPSDKKPGASGWCGELTVTNAREVTRQLVVPLEGSLGPRAEQSRGSLEVNGVYGFEDTENRDCMVCFDRPRNIVFFPCRHCCVCPTCLRSLREDKCPLCRVLFYAHVALPVRPSSPSG